MIQVQRTNIVVTTSVSVRCACGEQHFIEINNIVFDDNNNLKEINEAYIIDASRNPIGQFNASFIDGKVYLQISIETEDYVNMLTCISNTIESLCSGEYEIVDNIELPLTPEEYFMQQEESIVEESIVEEELSEEDTTVVNAYEETTEE